MKGVTMYYLVWNGEVIEEGIETVEEAEQLQVEYSLAFNSSVIIKKEGK